MKVCFLSGPALGHLGRLFEVALALRNYTEADIHFVLPAMGADKESQILEGVFEFTSLPVVGASGIERSVKYADTLECHFRGHRYDVIVQDFNPFIWAPFVRFPDCPRVIVTNVFLTSVHAARTVQVESFAQSRDVINRIRHDRGLPAVSSAYDFYQADRVLLADPLPIVRSAANALPAHYIPVGHWCWDAGGAIPPELVDQDDMLLLSMGSTGLDSIDGKILEKLAAAFSSRLVVYAGNQAESMAGVPGVDYAYRRLPLTRLLNKSTVVVSQGGAGSSYQALASGTPVVVFPNHQNHRVLGELLEKLGLGLCIEDSLALERFAFDDIRRIVERVQALAVEISGERGAARSAEEVLGLL